MDRVVMNRAGLRELEVVAARVERNGAEDVAHDARRFCPVDKGELRATIRADGNKVRVGTNHWAETEYGSRPHVIDSHGPWSLHSAETGAYFGRRVWHPGTPAQPFMRPALMRERGVRA